MSALKRGFSLRQKTKNHCPHGCKGIVCDGRFPWDDLGEILHGGERMAKVHIGEEILPKASTP